MSRELNPPSATQSATTSATASHPSDPAQVVRSCDNILEQFRRKEINRPNAVLALARAIPQATSIGSPSAEAFAQYYSRLEDEGERNASASRRGQYAQAASADPGGSGTSPHAPAEDSSDTRPSSQTVSTGASEQSHAQTLVRALSPQGDEPGIKRVKLDERFLPWTILDNDAEDRLGGPLNQTRLQLAEFQKDPRSVLNSLLNSTHRVSFPESEWLALIKGHSVSFDKIHSHRLSLASSYKASRRIAQGLDFTIEDPEPPNKIRSQGDWENAWYSFFEACTFIFPHRADELRDYHEWIHHRFEACHESVHQRVINLDSKVRSFAASRRDVALNQPSKFNHLEGSYLHEWGTGHCAASRPQEKAFSGFSASSSRKSQAPCNRFNEGRCPSKIASQCRYQHICSKCRKAGHTMEKCSSATDKPRPGFS
ncbi:hypothetical protein M378DRAFT_87058 [Amanita muscaria Koide BX008]|uniref:C3H1-type domain-containing protein n=1 Tax=Amanita muscaria (strain Koide BX008) TaxID=946122 RepID=A0A0C2WMV7_AMAMK|nr:hypothetical protein M378DRAFT_87058 [Amanita muscaria Koide BX008]